VAIVPNAEQRNHILLEILVLKNNGKNKIIGKNMMLRGTKIVFFRQYLSLLGVVIGFL
jgi:hypothetical protein